MLRFWLRRYGLRYGLRLVGLGALLVICVGIGAGIAQLRGRASMMVHDAFEYMAGSSAANVEATSRSQEQTPKIVRALHESP